LLKIAKLEKDFLELNKNFLNEESS
jgi:hypothetical protein